MCRGDFQTGPRLKVFTKGTTYLPRKGDKLGAVHASQVEIEAAMKRGVIITIEALDGFFDFWIRHEEGRGKGSIDCPLDEKELVQSGNTVYCVMIGTGYRHYEENSKHSIVLRLVNSHQGVYRRIGKADYKPLSFTNSPVARITII